MSYKSYKTQSAKQTSQRQKVPGKNQVKNNAGGYVFQTTSEQRLERFLVLGAAGSTYYVSQQKHTAENLDFVIDLIRTNGEMVVNKIAEISYEGRAEKNDHAIYALALCMTHGDDQTKKLVEQRFKDVVRIGSHLLMFVDSLRSADLKRELSKIGFKIWILINWLIKYPNILTDMAIQCMMS
jgi:60 kDa SS-A/Ro ribonucleoprotein